MSDPIPFRKSKAYDAIKLKNLGNEHFSKHANFKAFQCYTKAMLLAPCSAEDQQRFLTHAMEMLHHSSPSKHQLATILYSTEMNTGGGTVRDPLLSQCFGNRSAVLYSIKKYAECEFNIEQALIAGPPPASVHKLQSRRAKCRTALLQTSDSPENNPCPAALPAANNACPAENISCPIGRSAFHSDLVSVSSSLELGRHMIAAKNINPGDVIFTEDPFASVLDIDFLTTHCSYCFKRSPYRLLPCVLCPCESYCCNECMEKAWVKYHWLECRYINNWRRNADWMETLCLRIILSADPSSLHNAFKGLTLDGEYGLVCSLIPHEEKFSNTEQKVLLIKMAKDLTQRFGRCILSYVWPGVDCAAALETAEKVFAEEHHSELDSLERLVLRHLLQLRCNSLAVSEVVGELKCNFNSSSVCAAGTVETFREVRIGTVLPSTASFMNHSCSPNAMFRFEGNKVTVCAIKHVRVGEEVSNSYGPQVGRIRVAQRKLELKERYFFDCKCEACAGANPSLLLAEAAMDGLACLSCTTGALVETDSEGLTCCHCQARLSPKDLHGQIEVKEKAAVLFKSATCGSLDLDLLHKCHRMQTSVLHKYNQDLARTNDAIAHAYASRGNFTLSGKFLELSCSSVAAIYGEQSIEVANEMQKMAPVLFHSGRREFAVETAKKAKKLISIHRGQLHPDCRVLDELISSLSSSRN